jgi:tRNA dimethylallyltransferase
VAGPTAVGKTALCLQLAQEFNTAILSADSRQFYREMNIGTAKPTEQELAQVKHYFINTHSVTQEYSAGDFETDALVVLENLFKKKDIVILTGGSGLYIKALTAGMDAMPAIQPGLREQLQEQLEKNGLSFLLEKLEKADPVYYNQVDKANAQRIIRALEVCISSGQPYSYFRKESSTGRERSFTVLKIGLCRDRAELYHRIDARMDQMLQNGLLEEAKALYPFRQLNALQTVGYKEIFDYLEDYYPWEEAVRLLKRNSRRYAKRQLTWFKKDEEFTWFHPENTAEIIAFIQEHLPQK